MIKIISTTWGHHDSNAYQGSMLYRSFVKHNNPDNFINIHFNRGSFHSEEHDYGSRLGQMSEYILYKIHLTKQEVEKIDTEFIIFCDYNDVFCTGNVEHLPSIFDLDNNVIFSAERNDWPKADKKSVWPDYCDYAGFDLHNRFFLNSGVQLASKENYLRLLENCLEPFNCHNIQGHGGDQGVFTYHYNCHREPRIVLDYAHVFAWSTYDSNYEDYYVKDNKIYNKLFGTAPLFIHDNGSNYGGKKFRSHFNLII
jgi:hypothetical protein